MVGQLSSLARLYHETYSPKPTWTIKDVPDMSGKVVFITGGNNGIGKETARILLERGAKVYIASRSMDKARAAAEDLKTSTGKGDDQLLLVKLDLSDLNSVKAAADVFLAQESRLDILINNAGIMRPEPPLELTPHGVDVQFGTNVLGHFYLTRLLLPTLLRSDNGGGRARIVNLSSSAHHLAPWPNHGGPIVYESLKNAEGGKERKRLDIGMLYQQSKAGNLILSQTLARKYADQGIVSIALNPGNIQTDLWKSSHGLFKWILGTTLRPLSEGVISPLFAASAPEAKNLNGSYLGPNAAVVPHREDCDDVAAQDEMWDWMEGEVRGVMGTDAL